MKRFSKRLLAVMLSVMLVIGALPFMPITALADAESDLEDAIAYFETNYVEPLATDGYDALYTNMSKAYTDYLAAIEAHTDGTAAQMSTATKKLTRHWTGEDYSVSPMQVYADKMVKFTEPTANGEVKIGDGACKDASGNTVTSQPVAGTDYRKVIYSDGASKDAWDRDYDINLYGSYASVGEFQNYFNVYYPNTVVLNDGVQTDAEDAESVYPLIPVILGATSNGSNWSFSPQYFYESTEGIDLKDFWVGTMEGTNDKDQGTALTYTKPTWPNLAVRSNFSYNTADYNYGIMYVSTTSSTLPNGTDTPYKLTKVSGRWQIFRNSLKFTDVNATKGATIIESTKWLGAGGFWMGALGITAEGTRNFEPVDLSANTIYSINYVVLTNALKTFFDENKGNFTTEIAQAGGLKTYFKDLDAATAINPTDEAQYDFSTNTKTTVEKCGKDIDTAAYNLSIATTDDTHSQLLALDELINAYKTKMYAGKVYTHMTDAYDAYLQAIRYKDAIEYGQANPDEMSPTLAEVLTDLNTKTAAMKVVGAENYDYVAPEAFDGDQSSVAKTEAYKETYNGLVYASAGATRNRSEGGGTAGGALYMEYDHAATYLYLPKAVAIYDGSDLGSDSNPFTVPALLGYTSEGGGIFSTNKRWLLDYESTTADLPFLYTWKTRTYKSGDEDNYINRKTQEYDKFPFNVNKRIGESKTDMSNLYNAIKDGSQKPTKTYIENASLNDILNLDETKHFDDAKNAVSNGGSYTNGQSGNSRYINGFNSSSTFNWGGSADTASAYYSAQRSDHGGNTDDPENFFANVLRFKNQFTKSSTATKPQDYFYKYSSISAFHYTFDENTANNHGQIKNSWYDTQTGTLNTLGLYIINYYPVQKMIDDNDNLLQTGKLAEFGLERFTEGELRKYFVDMDRLTDCNPINYDFSQDMEGQVNQCAQDIWDLLNNEDTKVKTVHEGGLTDEEITAMTDVKNADKEHSTAGEDGNYYLLKYYINEQPGLEGACASGNWWTKYAQTLQAARDAMKMVATNEGYENDVTIEVPDYMVDPLHGTTETKTFTTISEIEQELEHALDILKDAPKTRHTIRFERRADPSGSNREQYDTGVFICTSVPPEKDTQNKHKALYLDDYNADGTIKPDHEEDNTADLGVYDALSFAYTTIDFNRYENDLIIESAKDEFDKLLDDGSGKGEVAEAGVEPQDFVDQKVQGLMEAINTANTDAYTVYYHPMFDVVDENGDEHDETDDYWHPIDNGLDARGVRYGETVTYTVPEEYVGNVYKWEFTTSDKDGNPVKSYRLVDEAVSGDSGNLRSYTVKFTGDMATDLYITAHIKRTNTDSTKTVVRLLNPYQKAVEEFVANKTDTVSIVDGALKIGDETYELTDAYNIPNYTVTGFELEEGKTTVGDYVAKDKDGNDKGYAEIGVAYEKAGTEFSFTMNGTALASHKWDEYFEVTSDVEKPAEGAFDPFVAIAIDLGENYASTGAKYRYLPISYTRTFASYAVADLDFVDITCNEAMNEFYANGTTIELGNSGDDSYYRFAIERKKTKMPFVWAKMAPAEANGEKFKHRVYSYYTNIENLEAGNDQAAEFVEAGTVFAGTNLALDDFKQGAAGTITVKANKRLLDNYYSTWITANKQHVYARSYVKYKYNFVAAREEGSNEAQVTEIEAIIYGDVVNN